MFTDNIGQFTAEHLKARGISLALVSLAPFANIESYRKRMGWPHRWVSSANSSFNSDFGMTTPEGERHGLSAFLRHAEDEGQRTLTQLWDSIMDSALIDHGGNEFVLRGVSTFMEELKSK